MIGQLIKTENNGELQTHTITRATKTRACWPGGSIAQANLCRVGTFWLEMAPPEATTKTEAKQKSQRGKKLHFVEDGKTWGNLPYCADFLDGQYSDAIVHSWRNCGLVKAVKREFWFFRVSDVVQACRLRDSIGRLVDGRQFYSLVETARRVGVTPGCVGGWVTRGYIEVDRPKSAVLVICWADVVQHCKSIGREIENES